MVNRSKTDKAEKVERGPLEGFKNQNLLLKKFGGEGIRVYNSIDKDRTVGEILDEIEISEDRFMEIIDFMEKRSMIDLISTKAAVAAPSEEELKPPAGFEAPEDVVIGEEEPVEPAPIEPVAEKKPISIAKAEPKRKEPVKEEKPKPVKKEIKKAKIEPIAPPTIEPEKKTPKPPVVEPKKEKLPEPPLPPKEEKPVREKIKPTSRMRGDEKEEVPEGLSPIEKIIYKRYKEVGVKVYNLIDGEKTAEEILKETGISEVKLIEILEFLDNQGIIKLEKPDAKKQKTIEKMAPFTEKVPEGEEAVPIPPEEAKEYADENIIPLDIPIKSKISFGKKLQIVPKIMLKFGGKGKKIFDSINGKNNIVDIALKNSMTLTQIDNIFEFFGKEEVSVFKSMERDEIRKRYGPEGFSIYKKFGRDGIMVYELISKTPSFKKIVELSGIQPERVIDIFIFIHKVLNLELPLTRQMMYRQLGL